MKNPALPRLLSILLLVLYYTNVKAQIGINNSNTAPNASAMLDVDSQNKGLLLPRVNLTSIFDQTTIANPAVSLMIYNTNTNLPEGAGFYSWNGLNWALIKNISQQTQFFIEIDGDPREFWVHVPNGYRPNIPTPLVIMLHGTSGDGKKFFDNSGWNDVADEESFIVAYPSSWRYDIINPDGPARTTKWNTVPDAEWTFAQGVTGKDDIKFLKRMIITLKNKLNIDQSRIYLEGFSNGGQMAAKCTIEMSDILAAVCENAGTFVQPNNYVPLRLLPVLFQIGNEDYGPGNTGLTVPLAAFGTALTMDGPLAPWHKTYNAVTKHTQYFGLNPMHSGVQTYTQDGVARYKYVDYVGTSGQPNNVYRQLFVNGLAHKFPNENNFCCYDAPREHYRWMKQFSLP